MQALAALAEFGGGLALIVGLLTPLASLRIFFTMLTALITVHPKSGNPFIASGTGASYETVALYLAISLLLLLVGPGKISLDALLFNRHARER